VLSEIEQLDNPFATVQYQWFQYYKTNDVLAIEQEAVTH
jgi:hypothetical protein